MILDPVYIGLIVLMMGMSWLTSMMVKSRFKKASEVPLRSGMSGEEVARAILRQEDIHDVEVIQVQGFLSDHYNPMRKQLALSPDVYAGRSAAAAGVAAHEVGHAIQHARGSLSMWMRSILIIPANIGSMIGPWLVILGIFLGSAQGAAGGQTIAIIGVALFAVAFLVTLITVPVEFDASAKAKKCLQTMGITSGAQEDAAVKSVLTAAGLTYVAAAISSLLMLIYWAWRAGLLGGNRND